MNTKILDKKQTSEELKKVIVENTIANIKMVRELSKEETPLSNKARKEQEFIYSSDDPFGCQRDAVAGLRSISLGENIVKNLDNDLYNALDRDGLKTPFVCYDAGKDPSLINDVKVGYMFIDGEKHISEIVSSLITDSINVEEFIRLKNEDIKDIAEKFCNNLSPHKVLELLTTAGVEFDIAIKSSD